MTRTKRTLRLLAAVGVTLFVTFPLAAGWGAILFAWARGTLPKDDPTKWPTLIGMAVVFAGSILVARMFVRGAFEGLVRDDDPRGWLERIADRHPRWFASVVSFNGFGLRRLGFHDAAPDGSVVATVWLTAAFLPLVPVRRERVRVHPARMSSLLVAWWTQRRVEVLARLPLDRRRNLVLLGLFWLVFLPLLVGPTFVGLAYVVTEKPSASAFWLGAVGLLAFGVLVVAVEERLAATPPRQTERAS